ncbi:unnamed protein product [Musa acuminata subsp. malaccensis]|uniref:(wild Malaysian banana) hypothetical protein n=1 Tax=Musa acuminata subsp. malaccensis TaxID=214687 RepID=A0A804J433_MUSAM|nr:unnamed protein product [Musa acuminata subsp. malaccensis]
MMKALCMRLFHLGLPAHRPRRPPPRLLRPRRPVHRRRHLRRHCPSSPPHCPPGLLMFRS